MIDLTGAQNGERSAHRGIPAAATANQPLLASSNQGGIEITAGYGGCNIIGTNSYILHNDYGAGISDNYFNASAAFNGTGQAYYAMGTPPLPSLSISGATGPSVGTYYYRILAKRHQQ